MIKKVIIIFIILMFGNSSFSQTDWNLFGSKILSFREDAEWRKNNNIKTIFEFDYLKSDTNKLHIINKYNFDTKGLIESYYQSPPNFYNDFKIEKPFKYTFFRKYNYTEVDSMLLQTITIYKRLEEGNIDTITKQKNFLNLNHIFSSKPGNSYEYSFNYDSNFNCTSFRHIFDYRGKRDTLITKLIYENGLLKEAKQESQRKNYKYPWDFKSAKYFYNNEGQMTKMVVLGNQKEVTYKFYYNKNNLITKKEMYFENRLSGFSKYIYVKSEE